VRLTIPGVVGPRANARAVQVNPQRSINLYPVLQGPDAKAGAVLYSTPRLTAAVNLATGAIRSDGVV